MFIIEANIGGGQRVLTFESNFAAYYFYKNISSFAIITGGINNRKLIIKSDATDLSDFDNIYVEKYYKDYRYNPNEHLIIVPYHGDNWVYEGAYRKLEVLYKKLIEEYKTSLNRKIIDIDMDNSVNDYVICLITTE